MKLLKNLRNRNRVILHILQQTAIVAGMLLLVYGITVSNLWVRDDHGKLRVISYAEREEAIDFEESAVFDGILQEKIQDAFAYVAIRGQLETNGQYDGYKEIDVTAYVNRHTGTPREYITARYFLQDLLNWQQYGFNYHYDVLLPDDFLSEFNKVTRIDIPADQKKNDMITDTYLNSDLESSVSDVSGNQLQFLDGAVTEFNGEIHINQMLVNLYQTVENKNVEDYVATLDEYYNLCTTVEQAAQELAVISDSYRTYQELFSPDSTNVRYCIKKTIGGKSEIYTNLELKSEIYADLELSGDNGRQIDEVFFEECNKYIYYDAASARYETNTLIAKEEITYLMNGYQYAYPSDTEVWIGVDTNYLNSDIFQDIAKEFDSLDVPFSSWLYAAIACFLLYLLLLTILTKITGKAVDAEGNTYISLRRYDKLPTELMILLAVFVLGGIVMTAVWNQHMIPPSGYLIEYIVENKNLAFPLIGAAVLLLSLTVSYFYYGFARRIKAHRLWQDSLLRALSKQAKKAVIYTYDNASVVLRVWPLMICMTMIHMILLLLAGAFYGDVTILVFCILMLAIDIVLAIFFYQSAKAREDIVKGIKKIRDGDLEHKISEFNLHGDNLILAQAVNSIGDGIRTAVASSMKDERMKADLVTNVSHDIKTPLTSIINYIDLIKRADIDNEQVREYVSVLDSKSQRLKQLTDDLVEASKISSGNISLNWESIDLVELVNQTIGEFSEKFEQRKLAIKVNAVGTDLRINADSRRMWRVIENLFNNVCKYALAGTRVYVEIGEAADSSGQVMLSVKNISEQPLTLSADELTERFIRGDVSRSTEGSGLGLSIAKSLTVAQKGGFQISMDGDLFKVTLTFPLLKNR